MTPFPLSFRIEPLSFFSMAKIPFVKPVAVFGLLQILVCFFGFFAVAAIMKAHGYPGNIFATYGTPLLLKFVRHYGLILILIPFVWTLWASWDIERESSPIPPVIHYAIGAIALVLLVWFFLIATRRAMVYGMF